MTEYDQIRLTENWRLGELLVSDTFPNVAESMKPSANEIGNLYLLAKLILQPTRSHFGIKMHASSGLRIDGLNALVGGSTTSLHPEAKAADIRPSGTENFHLLPDMFAFIRDELRGRWAELKLDSTKYFIHVAIWHFGKAPFCQRIKTDGKVVVFRV